MGGERLHGDGHLLGMGGRGGSTNPHAYDQIRESQNGRSVCGGCPALSREPDIPGNAAITFEVELLEVVPPVDFETVGEDELIQLV